MENFILPDFTELADLVYGCSDSDVQRALHVPVPGIADLAALLSPAAESRLAELAGHSRILTRHRFGNTIQLYAPVYLSNYCTNRCLYCGFSAENRINRRVLTFEEVEEEVAVLHDRGFNHILLVSGEASARMGVDYLVHVAGMIRQKFASVSIEVQPLSREEYAILFAAGITGVAVYQETYDRRVYKDVHLAGGKCDYDGRLQTPARVAAAGMREVGIGALLGLSDWRLEGLSLGMHLAWLRKNFWRTAVTVSFPRLRPAEGGFKPLVSVGERALSQLMFALRLFDPDVGLVLSTREEARFRDGMVGLGPTRYSAGSCTVPGGYTHPGFAGEQFLVDDCRSLAEVIAAIKSKGFDPVRKDWDACFQNS